MWLDDLAVAVFPPSCTGCGQRGAAVCRACLGAAPAAPSAPCPAWLDAFAAPFAYEGVIRELVARVKYRNERAAIPFLASEMVAALPERWPIDSVIVTWVPTTSARRSARGFDQSERLARSIARPLARPLRPLLRRCDALHQTGRSGEARRHDGPRFVALGSPPSVLLVDDVVTTGATMSAAAVALRRAGVGTVVAVAAARRA